MTVHILQNQGQVYSGRKVSSKVMEQSIGSRASKCEKANCEYYHSMIQQYTCILLNFLI